MFDIIVNKPQPAITVRDIQKLDIHNGDWIVISHKGIISKNSGLNMREAVQDFFRKEGLEVKIILFEEGMRIDSILRKFNDENKQTNQ